MPPHTSYLGSSDPNYMGALSSPHMSSASSTSMYRYGSDSEQYATPGYASMGFGLGYSGVPGGYGYLHGSAGPFQNAPDPYYDTRPTRKYEDKSRIIRSPLLEAFRADKTKRWGVEDMRGHIAEFMTDQWVHMHMAFVLDGC